MKEFKLDHDKDSNFIYLVGQNYMGSGLNKDLIYFEYSENSKSRDRLYYLSRMTRPIGDGLIKIIGVDLV